MKNFPVELEGIALRFPSFEAAFEKFDLEKPQVRGSLLSLFQGIAVAILRARQHKLRLGPRPFCCPSHSSWDSISSKEIHFLARFLFENCATNRSLMPSDCRNGGNMRSGPQRSRRVSTRRLASTPAWLRSRWRRDFQR